MNQSDVIGWVAVACGTVLLVTATVAATVFLIRLCFSPDFANRVDRALRRGDE